MLAVIAGAFVSYSARNPVTSPSYLRKFVVTGVAIGLANMASPAPNGEVKRRYRFFPDPLIRIC